MQSIQVVFFGSENIDVGTTRISPNTIKPVQKDQLNANVMNRYGNLIAWADMDDVIQYVGALLTEVHMSFMTKELGWCLPTPGKAEKPPERAAEPKPGPEPTLPTPEPEKAPEAEPEAPETPSEIPEPSALETTTDAEVPMTETSSDAETVVIEKDMSEDGILSSIFEEEPTTEPIPEPKESKKKKTAKKGSKKKGSKKKGK